MTHLASLLCNKYFSQFSSNNFFCILFSLHRGDNMGTWKHQVIWSLGIKMLVQMMCPPPLTRCPTGPVTVHNAGCRTQQTSFTRQSNSNGTHSWKKCIEQTVPINGDNIPPLWSVPTPSRNTQQIVLFLSHCGSYTGENHSRKICLRRISAWLCPLECHGMEGIEAAVDTKSLGNVKKVFAKSCGNPDFRSIFGHQRAKNEGTNTKIDRGPETYPISINPRDEMNRADSFCEKLRKPRFSVNFWPPEGQKWGHEHENR